MRKTERGTQPGRKSVQATDLFYCEVLWGKRPRGYMWVVALYEILRVVIPHHSTLTSLSSELLIRSRLTQSLSSETLGSKTVQEYLWPCHSLFIHFFFFYFRHTKDDEVMLGCLDRFTMFFSAFISVLILHKLSSVVEEVLQSFIWETVAIPVSCIEQVKLQYVQNYLIQKCLLRRRTFLECPLWK